ncbi:unnamed protein product [Vitrella brassicaformis CCMP3155]|uniref:Uncharacterized protein n=1 Tax=Vitrella brassicaformis (strain CCMP3155) TaxID=1169540 RepID=A0A0G4E905_VITBC|nr:unnamed protein product [Vitrella brassicaformis CCMP3155]|eukprot:CEL92003.1 unnamed protein product [Vitrella brassicaformis CCMP3155]
MANSPHSGPGTHIRAQATASACSSEPAEPHFSLLARIGQLGPYELPVLANELRKLLGGEGCASLFSATHMRTLVLSDAVANSIERRIDGLLRRHGIHRLLTYEKHNDTRQPRGEAGQQPTISRGQYLMRVWWVLVKGGRR